MKGKRLFVLSIDSLVDDDIEFASTLPVMGQLMKQGSVVKHVLSIYPTLTYPAHATMFTGVTPTHHGVYNNDIPIVGCRSNDWFWYQKDLKVPCLLDAAKAKGFTTASVFWAATGAGIADWVMPEMIACLPPDEQRALMAKGTTPELMETVYDQYSHILDGNRQNNFDRFSCACTEEIIRRYHPQVMICHLQLVDHCRHTYGVAGDKIREAVRECDGYLGRMLQALRDTGVYEDTNIFVVSDHGHLPVEKIVSPNAYFVKRGLITLDERGQIVNWRAYCHAAGLSAQIYVAAPHDTAMVAEVENVLREMAKDDLFGIEQIFTSQDAQMFYGLSGSFSFVLEGEKGVYFKTDWEGPVSRPRDPLKDCAAAHGHLPFKGMQPVLIASGPDIRSGVIVEHAALLDETPTYCRLLNLEMTNLEGRILHEILYE